MASFPLRVARLPPIGKNMYKETFVLSLLQYRPKFAVKLTEYIYIACLNKCTKTVSERLYTSYQRFKIKVSNK